jgi:hypothetical protein
MPEADMTALKTFATTVTSSISSTDVLTILGQALTAGVAIYLVMWGAKKIVRTFVKALNGKIGV